MFFRQSRTNSLCDGRFHSRTTRSDEENSRHIRICRVTRNVYTYNRSGAGWFIKEYNLGNSIHMSYGCSFAVYVCLCVNGLPWWVTSSPVRKRTNGSGSGTGTWCGGRPPREGWVRAEGPLYALYTLLLSYLLLLLLSLLPVCLSAWRGSWRNCVTPPARQ